MRKSWINPWNLLKEPLKYRWIQTCSYRYTWRGYENLPLIMIRVEIKLPLVLGASRERNWIPNGEGCFKVLNQSSGKTNAGWERRTRCSTTPGTSQRHCIGWSYRCTSYFFHIQQVAGILLEWEQYAGQVLIYKLKALFKLHVNHYCEPYLAGPVQYVFKLFWIQMSWIQ
jgi:hypothetical protein